MREQKLRRGMEAGSSWKPFGSSELIGSREPCVGSEPFGDSEPSGGCVSLLVLASHMVAVLRSW